MAAAAGPDLPEWDAAAGVPAAGTLLVVGPSDGDGALALARDLLWRAHEHVRAAVAAGPRVADAFADCIQADCLFPSLDDEGAQWWLEYHRTVLEYVADKARRLPAGAFNAAILAAPKLAVLVEGRVARGAVHTLERAVKLGRHYRQLCIATTRRVHDYPPFLRSCVDVAFLAPPPADAAAERDRLWRDWGGWTDFAGFCALLDAVGRQGSGAYLVVDVRATLRRRGGGLAVYRAVPRPDPFCMGGGEPSFVRRRHALAARAAAWGPAAAE